MADRLVLTRVRTLPLFERLPDDQINLIAEAFQVLRVEPGNLLFRQGQPAQGMFVFVSGRGVLTKAAQDPNPPTSAPWGTTQAQPQQTRIVEQPVGEVKAGDVAAETALFVQTPEEHSLRIVESAIVLFLSRQRFLALLSRNPELRANLSAAHPAQKPMSERLFKGQRSDEIVLQIIRRHWWSFARFAWMPLAIAAALLVGAVMAIHLPVIAIILFVLALVIPVGVMGYLYIEWQDDCIIITNQRVVRITNLLLGFQNSLSEVPLERVHQVISEVPPADPFAHMFKYGTITIKTAGEAGSMTLTMVPAPASIQPIIFAQRDRLLQSSADQKRRAIQAEIDRVLGRAAPGRAQPSASAKPQAQRRPSSGFVLARTKFVNEKGETVYRRHVLSWLDHIALPLLVMLGGIALVSLSWAIPAIQEYGVMGTAAGIVLFVVGAVWVYWADWDWRNDLLILGETTITLVRKRPLWLQNENEQIRLAQVDSVVSEVRGLVNNLVGRGDLRISLIGADQASTKVFHAAHNPQEIQAEISERQANLRAQTQARELQQQSDAITQYLSAYHQATTAPPSQGQSSYLTQQAQNPPQPAQPQTPPAEPPPQVARDAVRPPRIPRKLD